MWVKVTDPRDQKKMKGVLDNEPVVVDDVKMGDSIEFNREDIEQHLSEAINIDESSNTGKKSLYTVKWFCNDEWHYGESVYLNDVKVEI